MVNFVQVVRESAVRRFRRRIMNTVWSEFLREEFAFDIPIVTSSEIRTQGYFSQLGQDWVLDQFLFREMTRGTFIDVGAHNGVSLSNSWFLESSRNWHGVCIEPNPAVFPELVRNRKAICIQAAISSSGEDVMKFLLPSNSSLSMLAGLESNYTRSHFRRLQAESTKVKSTTSTVNVSITRLDKLAYQHNLHEPDLLLIDVEGAELDVLLSADWRIFRPKVILVESNYHSVRVIHFLRARNYELLARIGWDRIFVTREFPLFGSRLQK